MSVPVVVRLVGTVLRNPEVVGLGLGEPSESHSQLVEVQTRHLFVEVLGEGVHAPLVEVGVREELDLGDDLVRSPSTSSAYTSQRMR